MAKEPIVINGGNRYYDTMPIHNCKDETDAIYRLQFQMFQHLQNQIGLYSNMELGLHIQISNINGSELRGIMETIPVYLTEYHAPESIVVEPPIPTNRKCTLKERLKVLFKGGL